MSVAKVGFVIHPTSDSPERNRRRLAAKFRVARFLPLRLVHPVVHLVGNRMLGVSEVITSPIGAQVEIGFWSVPYTPTEMVARQPIGAVIKAARRLVDWGAKLVGLGAYTSIIGTGGYEIADALTIGVTTGNSLTAAMAIEGLLLGAERMGYIPSRCNATVVGATGSIGSVVSRSLAGKVGKLLLVGRELDDRLIALEKGIRDQTGQECQIARTLEEALSASELVVTVASATAELGISAAWFKSGAVVCDVARPRNIGKRLAGERQDLLVIDGGMVRLPGHPPPFLGYDFGFEPGVAFACMAETITLGLEGRFADYSLGKNLLPERVLEIRQLAEKHGLDLAGLRSNDRPLRPEDIARIRQAAGR